MDAVVGDLLERLERVAVDDDVSQPGGLPPPPPGTRVRVFEACALGLDEVSHYFVGVLREVVEHWLDDGALLVRASGGDQAARGLDDDAGVAVLAEFDEQAKRLRMGPSEPADGAGGFASDELGVVAAGQLIEDWQEMPCS